MAEQELQLKGRIADVTNAQSAEAEQLASRQATFDAASESFDQQKADWETQRASVQQGLDDRLAGLDALQVDLQSQRGELEKQQRQWEARCQESSAAQAEEDERLAAVQTDIDARLRALEERQAALDSRQAEEQRQMADRAEALDRLQAELAAQQQELDESRRSLEAERSAAALQARAKLAEPARSASPVVADAESKAIDRADDAAAGEPREVPEIDAATEEEVAEPPSRPSKAAVVDLAEILRQTGFNVETCEQEAASDAPRAAASVTDKSAQAASASITAPAPRVRKATHEDEVTIDDYMSRLLARNRGDEPPAPSSRPSAATTPAPRPATTPQAASKPAPVAAAPIASSTHCAGTARPRRSN